MAKNPEMPKNRIFFYIFAFKFGLFWPKIPKKYLLPVRPGKKQTDFALGLKREASIKKVI